MVKHSSRDTGVQVKKAKNVAKQITLTVAVASDNRLSFQLLTPKVLFHLHMQNESVFTLPVTVLI